jgi:hypothetical protein
VGTWETAATRGKYGIVARGSKLPVADKYYLSATFVVSISLCTIESTINFQLDGPAVVIASDEIVLKLGSLTAGRGSPDAQRSPRAHSLDPLGLESKLPVTDKYYLSATFIVSHFSIALCTIKSTFNSLHLVQMFSETGSLLSALELDAIGPVGDCGQLESAPGRKPFHRSLLTR